MAKCSILFNRLITILEDIDKTWYAPELEKISKEKGIPTKFATKAEVRYVLQRAMNQVKPTEKITLSPYFDNIHNAAQEIIKEMPTLSEEELESKWDIFRELVGDSVIGGVCACEAGDIPLSDKEIVHKAFRKEGLGEEAEEEFRKKFLGPGFSLEEG